MSDETRVALLVDQIRLVAREATGFTAGMTKDGFLADRRTQQAVVMNLMIIGEAASQLLASDPEFTANNAGVPWASMRGMRNRIAHSYFAIDMAIVWETTQAMLPILLAALEDLT